MEIKGKVIFVGDVETGTNKQGKEWQKSGFAVQFKDGEYLKEIYFTCFGKMVNHIPSDGDMVSVQFNVSSREYNGRWYTEASAWKVEQLDSEKVISSGDSLPF